MIFKEKTEEIRMLEELIKNDFFWRNPERGIFKINDKVFTKRIDGYYFNKEEIFNENKGESNLRDLLLREYSKYHKPTSDCEYILDKLGLKATQQTGQYRVIDDVDPFTNSVELSHHEEYIYYIVENK